jgi:small-conductance mechanosensitive channel
MALTLDLGLSPPSRASDVAKACALLLEAAHPAEADLRSELLLEILRDFKTAGIQIPYAGRDVRIFATPETQESPVRSAT